jgi:hypothetical protein
MIEIHLNKPIKNGEETISVLKLKEPTLGDLMVLDKAKGDQEKTVLLLCALTDLTPPVIKQIGFSDMRDLINPVVQDFLGDGPETGAE